MRRLLRCTLYLKEPWGLSALWVFEMLAVSANGKRPYQTMGPFCVVTFWYACCKCLPQNIKLQKIHRFKFFTILADDREYIIVSETVKKWKCEKWSNRAFFLCADVIRAARCMNHVRYSVTPETLQRMQERTSHVQRLRYCDRDHC